MYFSPVTATVRKLGTPPHLIMRIMDCVLLLFQRRLQHVVADHDRQCTKPSWSDSLKVNQRGDIGKGYCPRTSAFNRITMASPFYCINNQVLLI